MYFTAFYAVHLLHMTLAIYPPDWQLTKFDVIEFFIVYKFTTPGIPGFILLTDENIENAYHIRYKKKFTLPFGQIVK